MPLTSEKVAKMLGITGAALSKYLTAGKVPRPQSVTSGDITIYLWTEADVQRVRELLPKIKNGRKTRYLRPKQDSAKSKTRKDPQPRTAAVHSQSKSQSQTKKKPKP